MKEIEQMHARYLKQAQWTMPIRAYFQGLAKIGKEDRVLEIGSGTGAVLNDKATQGVRFGIDIDRNVLQFSNGLHIENRLAQGDGHQLPFEDAIFDFCFCHFLLLWVANPELVLMEMKRVTKSGGWLAAFAEPDYSGSIDRPKGMAQISVLQAKGLSASGAKPNFGSKLGGHFDELKLQKVEEGRLKKQANIIKKAHAQAEQKVWARDIEGLVSKDKLERLIALENTAFEDGKRERHVPTYYAFGQKA